MEKEDSSKSTDGAMRAKPNDPPDESLMADFASGSEAAFELIFDRYSAHIINFAYRFLNSQEESEDIAQEVFLRIYRSKERYDSARPFRPWLFSIASHLISNQTRFKKRHPKESLDAAPDENDGDSSYASKLPDETSSQPFEILEKRRIASYVRNALQQLPDNQRQAVLLARFEEMSYEEIGKIMGISVSAVKSLLFRSRQSLKELLLPCISEIGK